MREDINNALEIVRSGGIILYPTDTVWGIGCDATNPEAVQRIYDLKNRPLSKSMLVLVDQPGRIGQYVQVVPEIAWELMEVNDKPMTIIYPGAKNLAPNLIAADGSIGIRVTTDDFCRQLVQRFRKPIVSTSANISGQPSPGYFAKISDAIIQGVDYIVKHRQEDHTPAIASSLIKLGLSGQIEILRK